MSSRRFDTQLANLNAPRANNMKLERIFHRLKYLLGSGRSAFSNTEADSVRKELERGVRSHLGELSLAVERRLPLDAIRQDISPRERAMRAFSTLHMWDTARRNGVLIYVSLPDKAVEIVADRGIALKTTTEQWEEVCRRMAKLLSIRDCPEAARQGITMVNRILAEHFPAWEKQQISHNRSHIFVH